MPVRCLRDKVHARVRALTPSLYVVASVRALADGRLSVIRLKVLHVAFHQLLKIF